MLARLVDSRRFIAILIIAAGIAIPLAFIFSGAAAALVTLRRGGSEGTIAALAAWSLVAGLLLLVGRSPDLALIGMLGLLLGIVLMAAALGQYSALNAGIWVGIGLALAAFFAFWTLADDPVAYWRDAFVGMLDTLVAQMREAGEVPLSDEQRVRLVEGLQWRGAAGNVFGTLLLLACASLFLGRSWQARLVNPGGFRSEFHRLRLHRPLALATAACFMLAALWQWDWLLNVAAILLYVWIIQGFSVIHGSVGILAGRSGWLVLIYILCLSGWMSANPLVLLVPLLGLINEFFDVRAYVARKTSS